MNPALISKAVRRPARLALALPLCLGFAMCLEAEEFEPYPCAVQADCAGNLICLEGLCQTTWPAAGFAELCQSDADCTAPYSTCMRKTYHLQGVCSKTCGNAWDCPKATRCASLRDSAYCMPACERNRDCDVNFFCMYRFKIAGGSFCYPRGPADGADLLETCEFTPCREDLICLEDAEFGSGTHCQRPCHPQEVYERPASTCEFHGLPGYCDWMTYDPDTQLTEETGMACSPSCDTPQAREDCAASGWRCYPPGASRQVCWPQGRAD